MNGNYLRIKIKNMGFELSEVAKNLHISPQALNSKLNADDIKVSFLKEIAKAVNKTVYSFLEEEQPVISKEKSSRYQLANDLPIGIPLIPTEAIAGFGNGGVQVMDYDIERYIVPEFAELNVDFMIKVKGSSMTPKYNSGDVVACKKIQTLSFIQWNKVYVLDTEQGAMIKRLEPSDRDGYVTCISDNVRYKPFDLHINNDIQAVAIVVGVIRLE